MPTLVFAAVQKANRWVFSTLDEGWTAGKLAVRDNEFRLVRPHNLAQAKLHKSFAETAAGETSESFVLF